MSSKVPLALSGRLGPDATNDLIELINASTGDVMNICTERFERRLVEETSKLRVEMAGLRADVRQEISTQVSGVRQEISAQVSGVRQEIAAQVVGLRQDIASGRVELMKWAFLFWVGQLGSIAALLSLMLRRVP